MKWPTTAPPEQPPALAGYVAWRRRCGLPWQKVANAPTETEASAKLFDLMRRSGTGHWESVILPSDQRP
jgi:hypothetical protein